MPQIVHAPSLVGPFGGSIIQACLQSDSASSKISSDTSTSTATGAAALALVFVGLAAVLTFADLAVAFDLTAVLPEGVVVFFVAIRRSSQLFLPGFEPGRSRESQEIMPGRT